MQPADKEVVSNDSGNKGSFTTAGWKNFKRGVVRRRKRKEAAEAEELARREAIREDTCPAATKGAVEVITFGVTPFLAEEAENFKKEQAKKKARLARLAQETAEARIQERKRAEERRTHNRRHRGGRRRAGRIQRVNVKELRKALRKARELWLVFNAERSKRIQALRKVRQAVRSASTYCETQRELRQKIKALLRRAKERRQKKSYIRRHRELPDTRATTPAEVTVTVQEDERIAESNDLRKASQSGAEYLGDLERVSKLVQKEGAKVKRSRSKRAEAKARRQKLM